MYPYAKAASTTSLRPDVSQVLCTCYLFPDKRCASVAINFIETLLEDISEDYIVTMTDRLGSDFHAIVCQYEDWYAYKVCSQLLQGSYNGKELLPMNEIVYLSTLQLL